MYEHLVEEARTYGNIMTEADFEAFCTLTEEYPNQYQELMVWIESEYFEGDDWGLANKIRNAITQLIIRTGEDYWEDGDYADDDFDDDED